MNKIKVNKIYINLQQGILVMDSNFVVGGFCTKKKKIVLRAPGYANQFDLPAEMAQYSIERVHHLELYAFNANMETLPV